MRLCIGILPCLIKYKEVSSSTLQVPFSMAFSLGKKNVNDGNTAGTGSIFILNITTTTKTNTDTAATKRKINLSVIKKELIIRPFYLTKLFCYLYLNFIIHLGDVFTIRTLVIATNPPYGVYQYQFITVDKVIRPQLQRIY